MFPEFSLIQYFFTALIFIWTGFVRSGLGFGGAALGLPLMLLVFEETIFWIPVIGLHLLFFSGLTLSNRLHNVDWLYLKKSGSYILPAALVGVFGLINFPNNFLLLFIYMITLIYAVMWAMDKGFKSQNVWVDRILLVIGGYVSGTSLTGAPLMIAVFMRNVEINQLRNTLFVLWFVIVAIKLMTLYAFNVPLNVMSALVLLPVAAIGHIAGLKAHAALMKQDRLFKKTIGTLLIIICLLGLWKLSGAYSF